MFFHGVEVSQVSTMQLDVNPTAPSCRLSVTYRRSFLVFRALEGSHVFHLCRVTMAAKVLSRARTLGKPTFSFPIVCPVSCRGPNQSRANASLRLPLPRSSDLFGQPQRPPHTLTRITLPCLSLEAIRADTVFKRVARPFVVPLPVPSS